VLEALLLVLEPLLRLLACAVLSLRLGLRIIIIIIIIIPPPRLSHTSTASISSYNPAAVLPNITVLAKAETRYLPTWRGG